MSLEIQVRRLEVILTPQPAPVRGNTRAWGKMDPGALVETVRLLRAAGYRVEDDDLNETLKMLRADGLIRPETETKAITLGENAP